jgi:hypothetical protein
VLGEFQWRVLEYDTGDSSRCISNSLAIDKCLARTPDIRARILENIYEMCESRMIYGIEMWGLEGGWKQIDNIHSRFCKVTLGMPRSAANNAAELELGKVSRRGNVLNRITKYWLRLLDMDSSELVKMCYEWQMNNWAKKLKEELEKNGLSIYLAKPNRD